jgi:hypothetical protein
MRRYVFLTLIFCFAIGPIFAQHETASGDRLERRDIGERPSPHIGLLRETPTMATNAYIKIAAIDVDGSVSPSATLGLNHKEAQHPWFGEVTYKHSAGSAHKNAFSTLGSYQFWTGTGDLSPLLQADVAYSNRPGSNETGSADITGEISHGLLSLDAIAAYGWFRPKGGKTLSDFQPGVSAFYAVTDANLIGLDYTFNNKVDGESSFDIAFRHKLPAGYAVDVVVFKHNDVRLRFRKNFAAFRSH